MAQELAHRSAANFSRNDDLQVSLGPLVALSELEKLWRGVERRSDCSFFQSWAWIGCWLRHLPENASPKLLTLSGAGEVVGLGVLVGRQVTRHAILHAQCLSLNHTGDPTLDLLGLEYNGLVVDSRLDRQVAVRAALNWLVNREQAWDELNLGNLNGDEALAWTVTAEDIGLGVRERARSRCRYVTLEAIRHKGNAYLDSLSRNTRHQIRRALRLYRADGPVSIAAARDVLEAHDFFEGLRELHQASWSRRGVAGAFSSRLFENFHHDLIKDRVDTGEVQLLRVSAGLRPLGYLYNFVRSGWVYAYQSGFRLEDDSRLKPGLVSHCLAIEHNLMKGARIYDFMAGDSRYKRSLATDSLDMTWLVVQRPRARFQIENALRSVRHKIVGHGAAEVSSGAECEA